MKLKNFLFVILGVIFSTCISEENANSPIKISFDDDFLENTSSSWVLIHSLDGKLVEFSPLQNKEVNLVKINRGSKYHLSFLFQYPGPNSIPFQMQTTLAVPMNGDLQYRSRNRTTMPVPTDGYIKAVVSHDEEISGLFLSSESGRVSSVPNTMGKISEVEILFAPSETSYFLSATTLDGKARYQIINLAEKDQTYHFKFSDLKEYDKYLTILPGQLHNISYLVSGYKLPETVGKFGYYIGFRQPNFNSPDPTSLQIGFLDQNFPYTTTIWGSLKENTVNYQHRKVGNAPTLLPIPADIALDLTHRSISKFAYNNMKTGTFWEANWRVDKDEIFTSTVWNIRGEESNFAITEMPEEIIAINSDFSSIPSFKLVYFSSIESSWSFADQFRFFYIENSIEYPQYEEIRIGHYLK